MEKAILIWIMLAMNEAHQPLNISESLLVPEKGD